MLLKQTKRDLKLATNPKLAKDFIKDKPIKGTLLVATGTAGAVAPIPGAAVLTIPYIKALKSYILAKTLTPLHSEENLSENIVIQRIFNRSFDDIFKDNFTNTTKKKNVILRGVSGVRLTDDYENVFSKIFILEKNENDIYLIKLHSNNENSSLFSSIYTYYFNK